VSGLVAVELRYCFVGRAEAAVGEVHQGCKAGIPEVHLFGLCPLSNPEAGGKSRCNAQSNGETHNTYFHLLCLLGLLRRSVNELVLPFSFL
jgi:hypothetical protein